MPGNLMVQTGSNMRSLGTTSPAVAEGVGQDGSTAANFTDLLQGIVSGLEGSGNLSGGTDIVADGTTVSSDNLMALMQKVSNGKGIGSDKKSASGNSMSDIQMMTQLQASFAQPVSFIAPYQSNNIPSSDTPSIASGGMDSGNGSGVLIAALEGAIQKGDPTKQSVMDTAELQASGQSAGKQLNMDSVQLTKVAAQDDARTSGANVELEAFSAAAQKNLADNAERPAQNGATLNIESDTRLNTENASARNVATAATLNTADASALNSEIGIFNSVTEGTTGGLGMKEMGMNLNNGNKSVSGDAGNNTAFSAVTLQQAPRADDSQPAQETLPVNKLNELSDPIMKTLGQGEKNLLVKLTPPDMGTIEIRLKMENGVLTAAFKVDSTAVKDLFSIAMPQIKNSIESSGIKTGDFFADLKDDRTADGGRQQDTNQQQQRQQKEQKPGFFDFFA